jgi:lysophospholipase L1-like esterase
MNDEVVVALGVNDIGTAGRSAVQLLEDLQTVVTKLKSGGTVRQVILCTVPTFNFTGDQELIWRQVNQAIRSGAIAGADRVFDLAQVLSQAAPDDNLLKPEYMSPGSDPHPNGAAGSVIAAAFLTWYGTEFPKADS